MLIPLPFLRHDFRQFALLQVGQRRNSVKREFCSVTDLRGASVCDGRSTATQFRKTDAKSVATATHIVEAIS
jgi:hypothetical protein